MKVNTKCSESLTPQDNRGVGPVIQEAGNTPPATTASQVKSAIDSERSVTENLSQGVEMYGFFEFFKDAGKQINALSHKKVDQFPKKDH